MVDHSALLGQICDGPSQKFVSRSGFMKVLLHRESYRAGSGFFAYYDITGMDDRENNASPESIKPAKLQALQGLVLSLLQNICSLNCRTDYIAVYDGGLGSSRQLGRICLATRHVFISTSNAMTVVLYRNSFNAGPSFTAYYYITPQETTTEHILQETTTEHILQETTTEHIDPTSVTPEATTEATTAAVLSTTGEPTTIVTESSSTPPVLSTTGEPTTIVTESSSTPPVLSTTGEPTTIVTQSSSTPPVLSTTGEPTTIVTQSSSTPPVQSTTGELTTKVIDPPSTPIVCGGYLSLPNGSISGPYYPGNGAIIQCSWEIQVSPDRQIVLQFSYIRLDCNKEYIEIFDGYPHVSTPLGRTCSGIYLNYTYISTSNTMTILLHRDSYYSGNGFYASYYSIPLRIETTTEPPLNESTSVLSTTGEPTTIVTQSPSTPPGTNYHQLFRNLPFLS
uniref:deleted in malignant brain tumors 1 protein-like n=1 Tax=Podarcis muralis TaxID=64176 RepID=UPI00109FCE13|nr:deleted in malignant brain tumors 1 protein-like [Podarcis muralis]